MFSLLVTERSGNSDRLDLNKQEVSMGRLDSNDVVLPRDNVSKRHARLMLKDQRYVLVDLQSTNGTFVNGHKIASPVVVQRGDRIQLGDFTLQLESTAEAAPAPEVGNTAPPPPSAIPPAPAPSAAPPPPALAAPPPPPPGVPSARPVAVGAPSAAPVPPPSAPAAPATRKPATSAPAGSSSAAAQMPEGSLSSTELLRRAVAASLEHLAQYMDTAGREQPTLPGSSRTQLERKVQTLQGQGLLSGRLDCEFVQAAASSEAIGLGPLDRLLEDPHVREVVVLGPERILTDAGGGPSPTQAFFSSSESLTTVASRLLERGGSELDPAQPVYAVEFEDGLQVQVLLPPVTPNGPLISLQRPATEAVTLQGLVERATLSKEMSQLLTDLIRQRKSILVSGSSGAGVSSLIAALIGQIDRQENVVALQARPCNGSAMPRAVVLRRDASEYGLDVLLERASQLRPDRLVIDDVGMHDVAAALVAASQEPGVVLGMRAASVSAVLATLDLFVQHSLGASRAAAASFIAEAVQFVVHVERKPGEAQRVVSISRIDGVDEDIVVTQPIFSFDGEFRRVSLPPPA